MAGYHGHGVAVERWTARIQAAATPSDRLAAAADGVRALAVLFGKLRDNDAADEVTAAAADALGGVFEDYAARFRTAHAAGLPCAVLPAEPEEGG